MTTFTSSQDRDANRQVLIGPLPFLIKKTMTFNGAVLNDPGDLDGTGNPATVFTVTGDVIVQIIGMCKTTCVGAAGLDLGVAGDTQAFFIIPDTSAFLTKMAFSFQQTVSYVGFADILGGYRGGVLSNSNVIQTLRNADVTAGVIDYYCFWRPLSSDGNVVAA